MSLFSLSLLPPTFCQSSGPQLPRRGVPQLCTHASHPGTESARAQDHTRHRCREISPEVCLSFHTLSCTPWSHVHCLSLRPTPMLTHAPSPPPACRKRDLFAPPPPGAQIVPTVSKVSLRSARRAAHFKDYEQKGTSISDIWGDGGDENMYALSTNR